MATRDRRFIDFCVAKIQRFEKQDAKQDFPKGEEVETFDQKERALGFSRGILLMYSIEFLLGLEGPQRLEAYVKKARIPSAKKYVKDVVDLIERST
ncbi:hypothetical protein AKJ09_07211 [Labilithrix luteola]|uniref:Uncharacterized protein n=1 Tax=Labilithrix luteola TaxID=1391654 RepID=A0A0K1Q470_9BACT|nr:hypothetical protein AKJ09_07211 [Labilithrix luteola]